jgi:hypothetical protein
MMARDMEDNSFIDEEAPDKGTKEIDSEIRDKDVASLNDFHLYRVGTSITDHSKSI